MLPWLQALALVVNPNYGCGGDGCFTCLGLKKGRISIGLKSYSSPSLPLPSLPTLLTTLLLPPFSFLSTTTHHPSPLHVLSITAVFSSPFFILFRFYIPVPIHVHIPVPLSLLPYSFIFACSLTPIVSLLNLAPP